MDIVKKIIAAILIIVSACFFYTILTDIEQNKTVREMKEAVEEYGLKIKQLTICNDQIKIFIPSYTDTLTEEDLELVNYVGYVIPEIDLGKSIHLFITDTNDTIIYEKNFGYPISAQSIPENTMEKYMDDTLLESKLAAAFHDANITCTKWKESKWTPWTLTSISGKTVEIGNNIEGRVINFVFEDNKDNCDYIKTVVSDTITHLNEEGACIIKYNVSIRENGDIVFLESTSLINSKTVKLK